MHARNNLGAIDEEDEDCDETWMDGVSRIDKNDVGRNNHVESDDDEEETCLNSAFQSISLKQNKMKLTKNPNFKHTFEKLRKECMVDYWKDSTPNMRVSVQFLVESGYSAHKNLDVRVSTDGFNLVVTKKSSAYLMDANKALIEKCISKGMNKQDAHLILSHHPRVIARRDSVAKLTGRDTNQRLIDQELRIPLPYKCRHKITTAEDGDEYFYGLDYFTYQNGETYCHVDLIVQMADSYTAENVEPEHNVMVEEVDVDEDESEDELFNEFDEDTLMTEITESTKATKATKSTKGSRATKATKASKSTKTTKATKATKATKPIDSSRSSKTLQKSITPSKISGSASRKSTTPSRRTFVEPKKSSKVQDLSIVSTKPPPTSISIPSGSVDSSVGMSFLTPEDGNGVVDVYSMSNSTISTIESKLIDKHNKSAVDEWLESLSASKKPASNVSVWSLRSSRSRKSVRKSKNNDSDKSRSGRSSTESKSSKSSDTPSRHNLTSRIRGDMLENPFGPEEFKNKVLPNNSAIHVHKIPANIMPKLNSSGRITRSAVKRKGETESHSSDESHQKQTNKYQRGK